MIKAKKNFGCVIEKELYWGNEILAKVVEELKKMGGGAVGNLIHYKDPKDEIKYSNDDFTVFHLSIKDIPTNTIEWCEQGSKFIENQIEEGKCVYVHCIYGISRSSTQIMAFLNDERKQNMKRGL